MDIQELDDWICGKMIQEKIKMDIETARELEQIFYKMKKTYKEYKGDIWL